MGIVVLASLFIVISKVLGRVFLLKTIAIDNIMDIAKIAFCKEITLPLINCRPIVSTFAFGEFFSQKGKAKLIGDHFVVRPSVCREPLKLQC